MELKKYNENKIFVTGLSGSGKTFFAKQYSKQFHVKYFDFDTNWKYQSSEEEEYHKTIKKYPKKFITDAIPYTCTNNQLNFLNYYNKYKNNIKIICICCTNKNQYDERLKNKFFKNKIQAYKDYNNFYFVTLKNIFSKLNIEYFDSCTNEFISENELYKRIEWINENNIKQLLKNELKIHLDSQEYDKYYQDIECINFKGYSESFKTWENIENLIDWKGKKVADLGCFHCYFSFKIAKKGAIVTAFDNNNNVLETANWINEINGNIINIKKWEGGEEISSDYVVSLCLNVLHHFPDMKKTLQNIKSKIVIFETNFNLIDLISEEYIIIQNKESHRIDVNGNKRIILLCVKK